MFYGQGGPLSDMYILFLLRKEAIAVAILDMVINGPKITGAPTKMAILASKPKKLNNLVNPTLKRNPNLSRRLKSKNRNLRNEYIDHIIFNYNDKATFKA